MTRPIEEHRAEFSDFTEASYRALIRLAKRTYTFERFTRRRAARSILWRHDHDASVHRARRLAEIEHEEEVVATHFVFLRCPYYNPFHADTSRCIQRIVECGHDLGLHFDPSHYGSRLSSQNRDELITAERDLLQREFGVAPVAISFHNFGIVDQESWRHDTICGMINAYGQTLAAAYGYCSDSNGVWLYRRLRTVLEDAKEERLQVLTHPEWWTPEPMPPRARLQRAIDGYAIAMGRWYDDITAKHGRPNIR